MPLLTAEKLIIAFHKLSGFIEQPDAEFKDLITSSPNYNAWFTVEEVSKALFALQHMLKRESLEQWFTTIKIADHPKKIGLILAGNIPMVGFHDVISVLATGHIALIKLSSSDNKILPMLLKKLVTYEPLLQDKIVYVDRLKDFDAIIATGSNNTSRYFEYYFGKVPHIIRKNRNSVAILTGDESLEDIQSLGHDIFDYFGLGCRNVSKIYIPEHYAIEKFFEPLEQFQPIFNHFKYNNNYDYNKSIYLVNLVQHFDNGFLLLKEDNSLTSPLAVLHYEFYANTPELILLLASESENIQCMVSSPDLFPEFETVNFGASQYPQLWDYADKVNTITFLNSLSL